MGLTLLGLVALLLAVGVTLPQVSVSVVRGRTAGLSWASVTNSACSSWAWLLFAFAAHDLWLTATSGLYAVSYTALSVNQLMRAREADGWPIVVVWVALLGSATALDISGVFPAGLDAALVAGGVAWGAPQVVRVWRSADTSGVSAVSWVVAAVDASVWLAYAGVGGSWTLAAWAVVILTASVAVLARLMAARRRGHVVEGEPGSVPATSAGERSGR